MRKAILKNFMVVVLLTVALSGIFFYVIASRAILNNTKEDLFLTLQMLDESLDFSSDLQLQVEKLPKMVDNKVTRFTIINNEGEVHADSEVPGYESLENHKEREEVVKAKIEGFGYAKRYSNTLKKNMLYVAVDSKKAPYILRVAIPYSGIGEYVILLLPAILISMVMSTLVALLLSEKLSISITRPLSEVSLKLENFNETAEYEFDTYEYEELNVIARTVIAMSESIQKYMSGIEFEKLVRQDFFSNASHELKTPLTSIRGYMELLRGGFAKDVKTQNEFMDRIVKETENMTNLINDILMISRLETHEAEMVLSEVRMSILLEDVIQTLIPLANETDIKVVTDCKPLSIIANPQQIREVLSNLISNAIKYNKVGGTVNILITSENHDMILKVTDTGVGIPEDSINRVFQRFYRVDKGRSKKVGGTGLGLSIVKHIVNYYQGTIFVESKVDQGTTFTITLPEVVDSNQM